MADYAGAISAIKTHLLNNWTTTPLGFINEAEPVQKDVDGNLSPWLLCEVVSTGSNVRGSGKPGSQIIVYDGLVKCYLFVPTGTGTDVGFEYAVQLGDIFKNQVFYDNGIGCFIRTGYPALDGGNASSDDGLWFGITAAIPFSYWHRG
jgi:hypothetical protein